MIDDGGRYLIENFDISYVPSVRILKLLRSRRQEHFHNDRVLAFGSPVLPRIGSHEDTDLSPVGREPGVDPVERIRTMHLLPWSDREIRNIAGVYGDSLVVAYTGDLATEARVKSTDFSEFRYVHFATHSLANNFNPERSFIFLSSDRDSLNDGLL